MALFCPGHILDHIGLKWCFAPGISGNENVF